MIKLFPKNSNYYFIPNIIEGYGGLPQAMLYRADMFREFAHIDVTILTFNFDPTINYFTNTVINQERYKSLSILNMYDFLKGENQHIVQEPIERPFAEDGYTIERLEEENAFRFLKDGLLEKIKSFDPSNQRLLSIQYFNEKQVCIKREDVDEYGRITRTTDFEQDQGVPTQEFYYDELGHCYLRKLYTEKNGKGKIDQIQWFDRNGHVKEIFSTEEELQAYWIDFLTEKPINHFLIVDGRYLDHAVLSIKKENVYSIFVTHSTHLRAPYHFDSVLRLGNRPVLKNPGKPDGIVFFTEAQKADVVRRVGERNTYFVIPHAYKGPTTLPDFSKRDVKKAVVVARYHKEKQVDHAIKAFRTVVDEIPDAQLDLYGFGDELIPLQELIDSLNLTENVFLKGMIDYSGEAFEDASFSVLTSKYEGFGLVILESLAHGCPVVSYDIKYGPSDMITNGVNGYLVKKDDIEELAAQMIQLFKDPNLVEQMSLQAFKVAQKFDEPTFVKKWKLLFDTIIEQKPRRNQLSGFEFNLNKSDWLERPLGTYGVEGKLSLVGNYPKTTLSEMEIFWKVEERETREQFFVKPTMIPVSKKEWRVHGVFPVFNLYHNLSNLPVGTWDISLILKWNNAFFEKRIGYQKSAEAAKEKAEIKSKYVFEPYYTKPYGNLSFRVK
ncbi:glycosyltransferase [Litchfieldia alkalitelluris]|uniref:glycosyltransferase n=1 Tax=Litchfieldia alkalitelluris TaxID=304268 RepID=UPI000998B39B|nr:glycosyltransferase [Litchfieldia alkalitelluris]